MFRCVLFFLLLFPSIASAQSSVMVTAIPSTQIKGAPSTGGLLWVILPNGSIAHADLGPGVVLDVSGARPVIRMQLPAPSRRIFGEALTMSGPGNRTATLASTPDARTLRVYQNGIRQKEGADYTISGAVITFHASYGDMASSGALVLADYEVTP
jgi:hypothetical protein